MFLYSSVAVCRRGKPLMLCLGWICGGSQVADLNDDRNDNKHNDGHDLNKCTVRWPFWRRTTNAG